MMLPLPQNTIKVLCYEKEFHFYASTMSYDIISTEQ